MKRTITPVTESYHFIVTLLLAIGFIPIFETKAICALPSADNNSTNEATITLTTNKKVGETLELVIYSDNDVKIEGGIGKWYNGEPLRLTLTSQTISVTGKITDFSTRINSGITSLAFKHCNKLRKLVCQENLLTSLDLSECNALEQLQIGKNNLSTIIFPDKAPLRIVECYENKLESLNLSGFENLKQLTASKNKLSSIELKGCKALETLNVSYCLLRELDLTDCTALYTVSVYSNRMDATNMNKLVQTLHANPHKWRDKNFNAVDRTSKADYNYISKDAVVLAKKKGWVVNNNNGFMPQPFEGDEPPHFTFVSSLPFNAIARLTLVGNDIVVPADILFSREGNVFSIIIKNEPITILGDIRELDASNLMLTSIDLLLPNLTALNLDNNKLRKISLYNEGKIKSLSVSSNCLSELNLERQYEIETIKCFANRLNNRSFEILTASLISKPQSNVGTIYAVDITNHNEKNELDTDHVNDLIERNWLVYNWNGGNPLAYDGSAPVIGNGLITMETSKNINDYALISLSANGSFIIDGIEGNVGNDKFYKVIINKPTITIKGDITKLYITEAGLTSLDASKCSTLKELYCYKNNLEHINVENLASLEELSCAYNNLKSISLKGCTSLTKFFISFNQLESMDLSQAMNLQSASIDNNKLRSVNLRYMSKLKQLMAQNNLITSIDVSSLLAVENLFLDSNMLEDIDLHACTSLRICRINANRINEKIMNEVVTNLPSLSIQGGLIVIDTQNAQEQNVCNTNQVHKITEKNWQVYDFNDGMLTEYIGSEPSAIDSLKKRMPFKVFADYTHLNLTVVCGGKPLCITVYNEHGETLFCVRCSANQKLSIPISQRGIFFVSGGDYSTKVIL